MDPNFSVLLGDTSSKGECGEKLDESPLPGNKRNLVAIIVPIAIGVPVLVALAAVIGPKYENI